MELKIGTRDETVARMTSQELSAWMVLFEVRHEEAEHRRLVAESSDGQVIYHGRDDDWDPDEGIDGE